MTLRGLSINQTLMLVCMSSSSISLYVNYGQLLLPYVRVRASLARLIFRFGV